MARIDLRIGALALILPALLLAPSIANAVVLTGEVQAVDAQTIYVPQSYSSPVVLRYFVPEGERVKKGEVVLRIDMSGSAAQIIELDAQIVQAKAGMAKELAGSRVKAVDAELALVDAQAAQETAQIDAGIPADLISGLDYDRYQGELVRTTRELALKRKGLVAAHAAIARKQKDGALAIDKLVLQRDFHAARVKTAEVRAGRDGVVVHGFNNRSGDRIDEGSSVRPSSKAGEVVSGGAMKVRAWALEPDREGLDVGQAVALAFDALPGQHIGGRIVAIAGAPDARPEWGDGRYFAIDIELSEQGGLKLLPGMSVRVDAEPAPTKHVGTRHARDASSANSDAEIARMARSNDDAGDTRSTEVLSVDGEVYARKSAVLMPPSVDGMWMFNITRLAPDGAPVKKGDVVLSFDGNNQMQELTAKNSKLAEKQSELKTLLLDLAERERTERLATAEAQANLEKAKRKTEQPQALIPGIEYRKLVVAREQAVKRMALVQQREGLAAEQRRQERRLLEAEIAELQGEVAELGVSIASLNVKAPRDGVMMHKSSWNGEKFDVGSQVFRGQSVAEIPDTNSLAVRADLPERALNRVAVGMPVRVVIAGGAGIAVAGNISGIGQAVRSKSRAQPVPVLDLEITLGDAAGKLKPGQVVRVEITVPDRHPVAGKP